MSDYPHYPTDPSPAGAPAYGAAPPAARGPRPSSVDLAVKLIWATIVLSLLSAVFTFVLIDSIIDQQLDAAGATETISSDTIRTAAIAGAVFGLVISVGISALLAIFIGKGANWARIVFTVLAVLAVLGSLIGFGAQPVVLTLINVLSLLLTVAAVVLLFRPDANAWFKAR